MYNLQCRNGTDSLHLETPRVYLIWETLFSILGVLFLVYKCDTNELTFKTNQSPNCHFD